MHGLRLLVWLTQLGFSVVFPLVGSTLLSLWLRQRFDLGIWVVIVGIGIGIAGAVDGFRVSLKAMGQMAKDKPDKQDPPAVSFNDHQ